MSRLHMDKMLEPSLVFSGTRMENNNLQQNFSTPSLQIILF